MIAEVLLVLIAIVACWLLHLAAAELDDDMAARAFEERHELRKDTHS